VPDDAVAGRAVRRRHLAQPRAEVSYKNKKVTATAREADRKNAR
jgi:hypothetical protein